VAAIGGCLQRHRTGSNFAPHLSWTVVGGGTKVIAKTMSFLRDLFGPRRDEIWQQFFAAVGGNMTQGGFWSGGSKVDEPYKGRVFDPCCGSGGIEEKWKKFVEKGAEVYAKA
jgi:hypothetical protein